MKAPTDILAILLAICCICSGATDPQMDGRTPDDLRFVFELDSDTSRMTKEERSLWKKKILGTPDFSNRVYDLLWKYVAVDANEEIGEALCALGVKADLAPDKVKRITDRMRQLADHGYSKLNLSEQCFLNGGVVMLGGYPSHEHEVLVQRVFDIGEFWIRKSCVATLGRIGTRDSLGIVRKFAAEENARIKFAQSEEGGPIDVSSLKAKVSTLALQQLERRIRTSGRKSPGMPDSPRLSTDGKVVDTTKESTNIGSSIGLGWIAFILATTVAIAATRIWCIRRASLRR